MTEEDSFYIAIQNPREFRKELLNSNKIIIHLLQRYEKIKELREEKIKLMYKFSETCSEIAMLANKLKKAIPQTKAKNAPHFDLKPKISEDKPSKEMNASEIQRLQKELELIESKLSKLS